MKAKNDITAKIYSEVFEVKEQHEKVNQYVKAVIVNFGDERGDIIVSNDNFGTRRKYADFTKGKQAAGIHPLQVVFSGVDVAATLKDRYIGPDNQVHVFGEPIEIQKRTSAKADAQVRYDSRQRKVMVRFDTEADADLIAALEAQPSMTAYIKELVRRDMER